jgi:hypothetical protein
MQTVTGDVSGTAVGSQTETMAETYFSAHVNQMNAMFLRSEILVENSLMLLAVQLKRMEESTLISVTLPKLFQILISQWTTSGFLTNKAESLTIGTKILISVGTPSIENSLITNCRKQ